MNMALNGKLHLTYHIRFIGTVHWMVTLDSGLGGRASRIVSNFVIGEIFASSQATYPVMLRLENGVSLNWELNATDGNAAFFNQILDHNNVGVECSFIGITI